MTLGCITQYSAEKTNKNAFLFSLLGLGPRLTVHFGKSCDEVTYEFFSGLYMQLHHACHITPNTKSSIHAGKSNILRHKQTHTVFRFLYTCSSLKLSFQIQTTLLADRTLEDLANTNKLLQIIKKDATISTLSRDDV